MKARCSSLMPCHPLLLCRRGRIHPFFWHETLAPLHNDEPALLLSARIITCDRRTDARLFWGGFSFFFRGLLQDLSLAVAPSCIHRTDTLRAFQTGLMGFLQRGEVFFSLLHVAGNWFPMALFLNPFQLMLVLGTISELYVRPIEAAAR